MSMCSGECSIKQPQPSILFIFYKREGDKRKETMHKGKAEEYKQIKGEEKGKSTRPS